MLNLNNILDIKITKKLTILFITVTLGFAAIALTYWMVIKNEREATERSNLFIKYGQLVSNAQKNYFKVRRYEKDFLLSISASTGQTYNNTPLDEHAKYVYLLEQNMEQLRALSDSEGFKLSEKVIINEVELPADYQSELVTQASAVVENYKSSFADIVKFNQVVGFTDEEGLRKKANSLLSVIERGVGSAYANNVQSILAKIRSNEKHILQSIDLTESFEELKRQLQVLQVQLENPENILELGNPNLGTYMSEYVGTINEIVANKRNANEYTELFDFMLGPIFDEMGQSSSLSIIQNQTTQKSKTNTIAGLVAVSLIAIASLISFLLYLFGYTITKPINKLVDTIHEVNQGNLQARTNLVRKDELGELSTAFDRLLDEKVTQLSLSEKNNNELNESIISLLNSVAQLSKKDFTVKAPVFEDVTGALGDSLNFLTKETATALSDVKEISVRVVVESNRVQRQAKLVMAVAEKERHQVESIMGELNKSSNEMVKMSTHATDVNKKAEYALRNTHSALETVDRSVAGINGIRETIRQTEKRIKRLGERSQEITGIVNLMNSIAERTHILALNASMHAASSGEKGRGFSVVAEEVQRLAESARDATTEIESLVNNIRIETKDAVAAMNTAITQVADGTSLAEKAGSAMRATQNSTQDLVQAVNAITKSSKMQAHTNLQLVEDANEILESTRKTDQHLHQQMTTTNNLVRYSNMLLTTVGIFKLPVVEHEDKLANISVEKIQNKKTNIGVTSAEDVNLYPAARVKPKRLKTRKTYI
ncbi:MAG: HAMP domain-containing protein [Gammaproteobacteria bacterium]|nr:MAG: HAMP domain-containing protein [Gammaproteobacteria bacterium]QMU62661.1 MAG: HAMP domain-containing protein [Gammaproteobacteria bacterium]